MAAGSQRARLEKILLHHTRRRSYGPGELVLRQGDFGNSTWFVLQGTVRLLLDTPGHEGLTTEQLHKTVDQRIGWWGALKKWLRSPGREVRDPSALRREYLSQERSEEYVPIFLQHNWLNRRQPDPRMMLQRSLPALGYVDVLFIPAPVIERFVLPSYSTDQLRDAAAGVRLLVAAAQPGSGGAPGGPSQGLLEFVSEHRFINGSAAMVIDLVRCTRCDDCVRACSSAHEGNPRFVRHGPSYGNLQIANACMHCADPVCMIGCPTGAIHRSLSVEVLINDATCIGCSTHAKNCPYDNTRMVDIRDPQGELLRDGPRSINGRPSATCATTNPPDPPVCAPVRTMRCSAST